MWELYDALLSGIPAEVTVSFACRGRWQACVGAAGAAGLCSLLLPGKESFPDCREYDALRGRPLRELAALCKSWEPVEAALGVAALNAWYNRREALEAAGARLYAPGDRAGDVFVDLRDLCRGKTVSTVGHFRGAAALEGVSALRVFEREPRPGDLPDPAAEYLLPGSDAVVITGMALTNKTLPRLLTLAGSAYTALTGPSVPMTAGFFDFGVDALYGVTVWDPAACRAALADEDAHAVWRHTGKAVLQNGGRTQFAPSL